MEMALLACLIAVAAMGAIGTLGRVIGGDANNRGALGEVGYNMCASGNLEYCDPQFSDGDQDGDRN